MSFSRVCLLFFTLCILAACGSHPSRPVVERAEPPRPAAPPATVSKPAASKPALVLKHGGGFYQDDGPGDNPPDNLDAIADAEPRIEPLHRFANKPYSVLGRDYVPINTLRSYKARGVASWYGRKFHGQKTSSGEIYDMYGMSAAHTTLPIPSYARITNPANGKTVVVRVNDRGPFHDDRLIDLSYTAAWKLGIVGGGSALVEVESVRPGDTLLASDPIERMAQLALSTSFDSPAKAADPAPLPEVKNVRGVFLQLGAFGNSDNAESFKSRITRELTGFPDFGKKLLVQLRGGIYRIHLGPWQDHVEAQRMAERLREIMEIKSVVIQQ